MLAPRRPHQLGVVALKAPFSPDQPYDFAKLGDVLSTAIVPKQDATFPREVKLDVTRYLRTLALSGEKFHGLALRVVPDRGIDDGWTVRIGLPSQAKIVLEVESYLK